MVIDCARLATGSSVRDACFGRGMGGGGVDVRAWWIGGG